MVKCATSTAQPASSTSAKREAPACGRAFGCVFQAFRDVRGVRTEVAVRAFILSWFRGYSRDTIYLWNTVIPVAIPVFPQVAGID